MTSRVEAVRDAIMRAASENLTYEQIAQAAIEASDAWLVEYAECMTCGAKRSFVYRDRLLETDK